MANPSIWTGTSTFAAGQTPFGFYDSDSEFTTDADKVATFCAQRLGYPLVDVELQSGSFYTAFEEAVTTYGNELYAYKIRDNQLSLEGVSTGSALNKSIITPNFEPIVRLTEHYAAEAGAGGNVPHYTGSVTLINGQQDYDLTGFTGSLSPDYGIEVKRVFHNPSPAIVRYYDPYGGTGFGYQNLFDSFGFGGMSPAINFLMMPLNYDLATIQAIELNDQVRRSNYSFEIHDNKLRIFPIPNGGKPGSLFIEYIHRDQRLSGSVQLTPDKITNVSDTPYENPTYSYINSVGRQWIFEYALALSKEMLGYVRGKYGTVPIPGSEVTLNQQDLITAATAEKTALLERLRNYFEETSRKALLERKAAESEYANKELLNVPYTIYIG